MYCHVPQFDIVQQVLNSEVIVDNSLIFFQDFVRKMKELLPTVPGDEGVEDPATEIKGTVQSPQVSTDHLYSIVFSVGIPNSVPITNLGLQR